MATSNLVKSWTVQLQQTRSLNDLRHAATPMRSSYISKQTAVFPAALILGSQTHEKETC